MGTEPERLTLFRFAAPEGPDDDDDVLGGCRQWGEWIRRTWGAAMVRAATRLVCDIAFEYTPPPQIDPGLKREPNPSEVCAFTPRQLSRAATVAVEALIRSKGPGADEIFLPPFWALDVPAGPVSLGRRQALVDLNWPGSAT